MTCHCWDLCGAFAVYISSEGFFSSSPLLPSCHSLLFSLTDNLFNTVFRAITYFLTNHSVLSVVWGFFFPPMCLLRVYDKGEKQGVFGEKMLRQDSNKVIRHRWEKLYPLLYTKGSRLWWVHSQFSLTFAGIAQVQRRWVCSSQSLHTLKIPGSLCHVRANRDVLYNTTQRSCNPLFPAPVQGGGMHSQAGYFIILPQSLTSSILSL